ncbi:hypothetical protein FHL15_010087 [Xylaria flabelliformis]|uniref:Heterokaryon incompatibility domain-containing protein n=1 Tax=Xylaria flabelliformis TaxID=2512241 RepID=A0A553HM88_9PEZI|nr:hypothetical protein FHL15_010087 [Xylaria flabelliformis]
MESSDTPTWDEDCNVYGSHKEPRYNAITYTWGRFQLAKEDPRYLSTDPLPIKGVKWQQHLPRISPEHFTVKEMIDIIRVASKPALCYPTAQFVWLDIACIDQTPDSEDYYREIARQAKIFRGAADVFVWLTTMATLELEHTLSTLADLSRENIRSSSTVWLSKVDNEISRLTKDPWFTSLWTLQEAFLSPQAIMLSREGVTSCARECLINSDTTCHYILREFTKICHSLRSYLELVHENEILFAEAQRLRDKLNALGFLDGVYLQTQWDFAAQLPNPPVGKMGNPFSLLTASHLRTTTNSVDRVYGIMQVFNLQLGKANKYKEKRDFTLVELTDELSAMLILKYPITSQLIIQHCQSRNSSWRINSYTRLPDEAHDLWRHSMFSFVGDEEGPIDVGGRGALLGTTLVGNERWANFIGQCTSCEDFFSVFEFQPLAASLTVNFDEPWFSVFRRRGLGRNDRVICEQILHIRSKYESLDVLFLGHISPKIPFRRNGTQSFHDYINFKDWGIGLLLVPSGEGGCYKRLGTLIWDFGEISSRQRFDREDILSVDVVLHNTPLIPDALRYLEGEGGTWQRRKGLFG